MIQLLSMKVIGLNEDVMTREEWISYAGKFSVRDAELLSRSFETIMKNVYASEGYPWSPYRCISPAMNGFIGIWNWDSAFHAIGVARWDVQLARESILGFLQFQRKDGLIPDVVWEDGRMEDSFSKPPVFPWAVEIVYRYEPNLTFLENVYPKLVQNEEYWIKNRCYEGLFFYDADNKER